MVILLLNWLLIRECVIRNTIKKKKNELKETIWKKSTEEVTASALWVHTGKNCHFDETSMRQNKYNYSFSKLKIWSFYPIIQNILFSSRLPSNLMILRKKFASDPICMSWLDRTWQSWLRNTFAFGRPNHYFYRPLSQLHILCVNVTFRWN